jgi:hypothetical protein
MALLSSRVFVLTCAKSVAGVPLAYNGVNFSWRPTTSRTSSVLFAADATLNGVLVTVAPRTLIPQPPPGTDGAIFGFHHDDYTNSAWTPSLARLPASGHTRMATWRGSQ